jgi:tRNA(Leu) C34 or U34 (ribose-2'-O)-methylase TrmL
MTIADGGGLGVYVAGFETNELGNTVATLWKNGEAKHLSDGSANARAKSVYVSGDDVYVAGTESDTIANRIVAKLWKNGETPMNLSNATHSVANSVFVK